MKSFFLQFLFMLCCVFCIRTFNVYAENGTSSGRITPELRRAADMTGGKIYHVSSAENAAKAAFDLYLQTSQRKIITTGSVYLTKRKYLKVLKYKVQDQFLLMLLQLVKKMQVED